MSHAYISSALRQAVVERAGHRCCYCQTAEDVTGTLFTIDHIIPESLGGSTTVENLCLACWSCNLIKRDRIVATDPETGATVRIFNPNSQKWHDHFVWQREGLLIGGLTSIGRATINAIRLNRPELINARRLWIKIGGHPPQA